VRYNENATNASDVQTLPFSRDAEEFKEIAPATFDLKGEGQYTEPFKTSQVWVVLQLVKIVPEHQLNAVFTGWNIYEHAEFLPYDALDSVLATVKP